MEGIGLALLYPAREWSVHAPGHHGYPRALASRDIDSGAVSASGYTDSAIPCAQGGSRTKYNSLRKNQEFRTTGKHSRCSVAVVYLSLATRQLLWTNDPPCLSNHFGPAPRM
jgi:hypothetical protein